MKQLEILTKKKHCKKNEMKNKKIVLFEYFLLTESEDGRQFLNKRDKTIWKNRKLTIMQKSEKWFDILYRKIPKNPHCILSNCFF